MKRIIIVGISTALMIFTNKIAVLPYVFGGIAVLAMIAEIAHHIKYILKEIK